MRSALLKKALVLSLAALPWAGASAQNTEQPLRLVVPYSPGGTTDHVARLLQKPLGDALGRTVVVENKPGAAGTIGTEFVARDTSDGNTILFGNPGPNAIVPALRKTSYDPIKDLKPLTTVAVMPLVLLVRSDEKFKSLNDFLQWGKGQQGKLTYGSSGIGSLAHLTGAEFSRLAGLDMMHVPYQGGSQVLRAIIQKDVFATFVTGLESAGAIETGKFSYLAVASPKRMPTLPNVPAIAEALPGFESVIWFAIFTSSHTTQTTADKLRAAVIRASQAPEFQDYLKARHSEVVSSTPDELTQRIKQDMTHWRDVAKKGNIPLE